MADLIITESGAVHRPRNVDWKRAAALLYGDWGTSKAYVIGLAFLAAGFSSLPIILAVCALTGLVGINYIVICRHFPDGGGVYSAARSQGRLLAVVGALLLLADLTVTAALSGWSALTYITSGAEHIAWIKLLRDHIALTFQDDWTAFQFADQLGPQQLMWANDFPHSDSTWPWSQDVLAEQTKNLSPLEKDQILHDNVAELYHLAI